MFQGFSSFFRASILNYIFVHSNDLGSGNPSEGSSSGSSAPAPAGLEVSTQ